MFIKHIDHRIPKRKRDENPKEKHDESTIRKQNRNDHSNEDQNKILLKSLNTDLKRLKIIKPFEEHQGRNKQHHRNPNESENGKEIVDHAPRQRIDHKQKEVMSLETSKKITRFRLLSQVKLSVDLQKTNVQRENDRLDHNHHLQKQDCVIGLHQRSVLCQKSLTVSIKQILKLLDLFKKPVISERKRTRKHRHRKIDHTKQKLKRQSSHPVFIGFCQQFSDLRFWRRHSQNFCKSNH